MIRKFKNRMQAGELLAKVLAAYGRNRGPNPAEMVLALPRGGVPVGYALARKMELPLDVLAVRKLGVPGHEECAMGAIAAGGLCVMKAEIVGMFDLPPEAIEAIAKRELHEIERRERLYRAGRPALQVAGRVVIVVDDGLATGATMLAAVKTLRKEHVARVIVAVPVAPAGQCRELEQEADEVVCLRTPEPFHAVGLWYEDFTQTSDEEVMALLGEAWQWRFAPGEKSSHSDSH